MTGLAVALAICLVASNWLWLRHLASRERSWDMERTRLLNRVLHPEIPQPVLEERPMEDAERFTAIKDDYELVGTIQNNGSDEDDEDE